jgi:SAM-dependent methyltransferase
MRRQDLKVRFPTMHTSGLESEIPRRGRVRNLIDYSLTATHYSRAIGRKARQRLRELHVVWVDEQTIQLGDTQFYITFDPSEMASMESTSNRFIFAKARNLVDILLDVAPTSVQNIVDLGIFKGGSVAFYEKLFSPRRLVAIEANPARVVALDEFIEQQNSAESVRLYYGADQGDQVALREILRENFALRSLDLVVDDCSHLYGPTKASLNVLLAWLRPGGVYLIEDWGWAHWQGEQWQAEGGGYAPGQPALSNLIIELIMLCATRPDLIEQVNIAENVAVVIRGAGEIDDGDFDISTSYLTRGVGFEPLL